MKFFKFLSASGIGLLCLAAVSLTVTKVQAQAQDSAVVDDCEGGTNQNLFGDYWYFYDDSADGGNSKIAGVTRDPTTGDLLGVAPIAGQGINGTAGYELSYTLGTTKAPCLDANKKPIAGCGYNYVGVGTMLAAAGSTCDLTGATAITFYAKASAAMTLNVEVATSDVTDFNNYRALIKVTTSWAQYTINLTPGIGIAQQTGWGNKVDFNPKHVQKIQWQVHTDQTPPATGVLNIDQVVIQNYSFIPPDVCAGCLTMAKPSLKALLSDFETTPVNVNTVGRYWYCYNDGQGRTDITSHTDYSDINDGVTADPTLALGASPLIAISGHGNPGNAAYIGYQLGKNFTQGTNVVKPFVGVGTSLDDQLATTFYNATADGVTGVMFDYLITGASYLRLEVVSSNDLSAQGIVWYRLFPKAATWQTAIVPFDSLVLPNWDNVKAMDPTLTMLKRNALEKIQFAVQDAAGLQGTIAVDNVYFIGASKITPLGAKVLYRKGNTPENILSANLTNRNLIVTLPSAQGQHIGTISLVNIKGEVISQKAVNVNGGSAARLDVSKVASGMYYGVIKTRNLSGKVYSATIPVNIY